VGQPWTAKVERKCIDSSPLKTKGLAQNDSPRQEAVGAVLDAVSSFETSQKKAQDPSRQKEGALDDKQDIGNL